MMKVYKSMTGHNNLLTEKPVSSNNYQGSVVDSAKVHEDEYSESEDDFNFNEVCCGCMC